MDDKKKETYKFSLKEVIVLIIVTATVSLITGFAITNRVLKDHYNIKKEKTSTALNTFIKNYNYILNNYYGELDENKLLDAALEGVINEIGDPYATYLDEEESDNFNAQLDGSYKGIGIEISTDKIVSGILKNSPAANSEIKIGDIIEKVNDVDVKDKTSKEIATMIKSSKDNTISITVKRDSSEITLKINKSLVELTSVSSHMINTNNKKIGYIGISIFANNTYAQVKTKLEELEKQNIDHLIIDVRSNTGGHLTSVENILSLFLDSNHILYQTEGKSGIDKFYSTGKVTKKYGIVILTNEYSASASEILAAALKEEYGAKTVGKKTYGKGSAQELKTLPDGTQYKFTIKKWLTPKGNSIDAIGVTPDLEVEFNSSYYDNPVEENDDQLQAAIKLIEGN